MRLLFGLFLKEQKLVKMVLIADSGSTKTDWRLIDNDEISQYTTIGLNPDFVNEEQVRKSVSEAFQSIKCENITEIFFYGSGCSSESRNSILFKGLQAVFLNATITIEHDLLGASRAACGNSEGIAGILGTGSNSCVFDGENITDAFRSGGFIISDEGGGVDIGKRIVKAYIENKFEEDLRNRFDKRYKTSVDEILENLYKKPYPNKYLANFSRFAFHNKENPFIASLLADSFQDYFENRVLRFEHATSLPLSLVGSIAFYYQEIIRKVAVKNGINIGRIIEKPISGLTLYHSNLD